MRSTFILFWLASAVCLVAHVGIVRSVVRSRQSGGRWAADATWAVIPALGLAAILVWTWHVLHAVPPA
jgi:heme/copper-type cytochrome/quinol oxidase subunit 2